MRRHIAALALVFLASFGCFISPQAAASEAAQRQPKPPLAIYLDWGGPATLPPRASDWDGALKAYLKSDPSPLRAAERLAKDAQLTTAQMLALEQLWFRLSGVTWDEYYDFVAPAELEPRRRAIDRDFIALVAETGRNPLVVEAAVIAVSYIGRCHPETYHALLRGTEDMPGDGWRLVRVSDCAEWALAYMEALPQKSLAVMAYLAISDGPGGIGSSELKKFFTGDVLADHVSDADLVALRAFFAEGYLSSLAGEGRAAELVAFYRTLPTEVAGCVLDGGGEPSDRIVDGLELSITGLDSPGEFRRTLSAAHYVAGEDDTVGKIAAASTALNARRVMRAWQMRDLGTWRKSLRDTSISNTLLLDLALNHPEEDPYDVLEYVFNANFMSYNGNALWAGVLCKRLEATRYTEVCDQARAMLKTIEPADDDSVGADGMTIAVRTALRLVPGKIDVKVHDTAVNGQPSQQLEEGSSLRITDTGPLPSPFTELPLPAQYAPQNPPANKDPFEAAPEVVWPRGATAPLGGFMQVRVEKQGRRIVSVSLSQDVDPTGELTAGGYWVHVSDDGGKSWRPPLYTGLAENFPYVVVANSSMPMIDGETLNIEVEVREVDVSQIVYPPIGVVSKRQAKGLYLQLPLSLLEQDTDHDGLTDILEGHLLLSPTNRDTDGDGIPDNRDPMPNVAWKAQGGAAAQALSQVLQTPVFNADGCDHYGHRHAGWERCHGGGSWARHWRYCLDQPAHIRARECRQIRWAPAGPDDVRILRRGYPTAPTNDA